ncbi:MAG: AEC family transporter [Bacteroidia bacterium]|nr:AEC family transporter [Bacteroidia bacterium]
MCLLLRKYSIIREEDGNVFARLMTQAVLPAVIFFQLSAIPLKGSQFLMVLAMIITGLISMSLALLASRLLKLSKAKTGALMLTSSFGSSAILGYPFIIFAFPNNPEAISDAVLLSELGVGLPMFILGPAVAMYYGDRKENFIMKKGFSLSYFRSPIFIAVLAGIAVSFIPVNRDSSFIAPFIESFKMINGAMAILACLILSLQIKFKSLKGILPLFFISAILQMWFQPFISHTQASWYHLSTIQSQILVLISSMPSAILGPIFAKRYNCAPETASALVLSHIIVCIVMIPVVFYFMG